MTAPTSLRRVVCQLRGVVAGALRSADGGSGAPAGSGQMRASVCQAGRLGLLWAVAVCAWLGAASAPALADSCPNAQYRTGYSSYLPDCRAYELVTPPGARPEFYATGTEEQTQAALDGGSLGWFTYYPPAGSASNGFYFLASRGASGWSSQGVIPPQSPSQAGNAGCNPSIHYSPDLSRGVLIDGGDAGSSGYCGSDDPALVAGEPQGVTNLFLWDRATGSYQLISPNPVSGSPANAELQGASSDFSHVVFEEQAQLTADAPSGVDLYEWVGGQVHLVSYLPDGTPVPGTLGKSAVYEGSGFVSIGPGSYPASEAQFTGAVSADGSRVFFQAGGNLYVRENADQPPSPVSGGVCATPSDGCTVQVDATQGGSGPGGGGQFMWASGDGSKVFFTDDASAGLTADTQAGSGENLYEYDLGTGTLADLTPAGSAGVQGVSGVSADGAYVYFVADGALASGATAGQPNLYLLHAGVTQFIATLHPGSFGNDVDYRDWDSHFLAARVSADGRYLAFNSINSLTGYDNVDANTGNPDPEIFLYDASDGRLSCLSCDRSGAPPTGGPAGGGGAMLPSQATMTEAPGPGYQSRSLLADGRVFFSSADALLAGAINGQPNVYESEPDGVGGCVTAGGCLYLLSSGSSAYGSFFFDASASGSDVFIGTTQDVVGSGQEGALSLYDVRVDGGYPPAPSPPTPCTGTTCNTPGGAPPAPTLGTVTFSGPGNSSAPVRVRVLSRVVRGTRFLVRVRVPQRGRLVISGRGIRTVRRWIARPGTFRLRVTLTRLARRALAHHRRFRAHLRVLYRPGHGAASTARLWMLVEPSRHRFARRATDRPWRAATAKSGVLR